MEDTVTGFGQLFGLFLELSHGVFSQEHHMKPLDTREHLKLSGYGLVVSEF